MAQRIANFGILEIKPEALPLACQRHLEVIQIKPNR